MLRPSRKESHIVDILLDESPDGHHIPLNEGSNSSHEISTSVEGMDIKEVIKKEVIADTICL